MTGAVLLIIVMIEITAEHPDVVKAVEEAVAFASSTLVVTEEMYIAALKIGIANAEEKKRERMGSDTWYAHMYLHVLTVLVYFCMVTLYIIL